MAEREQTAAILYNRKRWRDTNDAGLKLWRDSFVGWCKNYVMKR